MRAAIQRANGEIDEPQFSIWLRHIANMQNELVADGALILKFFLHTPAKEQKKKLKKAEKDPHAGWQVDQRDWAALDTLGPVLPIAERILRETSGPGAPWTIVESTDSRYRDLTVANTILAALTARLSRRRQPAHSRAWHWPSRSSATTTSAANVLSGVDLDPDADQGGLPRAVGQGTGQAQEALPRSPQAGVSTVLAFEGWDAAGKGGVIRRVTGALEAGDYRVIPVAAPTEEERKYPLPVAVLARSAAGRQGRHLRPHLVRPRAGGTTGGLRQPAEWQRAFDEINDFEAQMVEHGYYVAKFWLHVSPEEQLARFKAREDTAYKKHKITEEDYRNRERWDEYVKAVDQKILRTTTDRARWHVIPANNKQFARVATLRAINKGLARTLRDH